LVRNCLSSRYASDRPTTAGHLQWCRAWRFEKQITIETAEGNLIDFDINKKTRVLRGKKQIAPEDLQTGASVTIEAKQEFVQYLVAVTITAQAGSKK
jgi:hypothetical protein